MFTIYVIECDKSTNRYIGLTRQSIHLRLRQHINDAKNNRGNTAIGAAIRKHGADSFSVRPMASCASLGDAQATEKLLIAQERTQRPHGYNVACGGEAGFNWMTEGQRREVRKKVSKKAKGRVMPKSFGESISKTKKGKPLSKKNLDSIREGSGRWMLCVTTGDLFFGIEGLRDLSKKLNVDLSMSTVVACCRGHVLSCKGYQFQYAEDAGNKIRPKSFGRKPVVSDQIPGFVFLGVTYAAAWLRESGKPKAASSPISKSCKDAAGVIYGHRWSYYDNSKDTASA